MRRWILIGFYLSGFLFLAGLQEERVIAKVNGEKVYLPVLQERVISHSRAAANQEMAQHDRDKLVDRALQEIISNRIVMQEAKARGIPEVTEEDFRRAFSHSAMTLPNLASRSFQEDWMVGLLRERLVEKLIHKVTLTQKELQEKFEEIRGSLQPEVAEIRWIIVTREEEARGLLARLEGGEDFADLARSIPSIDEIFGMDKVYANRGGYVGLVRPHKIPQELSKEIFAPTAVPGLLKDPIEVKNPIPFYGPGGWYIVKIEQIIREGETSLEKWRPVVEAMVRKEKATKLLDETLAKRRKQVKLWIEKDLVSLVASSESKGKENE
jgi:parvulin-like peptidyl-prolyl isomerase